MHSTIEQEIMKLAMLCTPIQYKIDHKPFRVIAQNERPNLIQIGRQHKCQIEIEENIENFIPTIPKATTQDHISNNLTATAIKIIQGDLATQNVILIKSKRKKERFVVLFFRLILLLSVRHQWYFDMIFLKKRVN